MRNASPRRIPWWDILIVGAACAAFLALTTHQITLPGLYYDEALDAVPAMQIVQGQPTELLNGASLDLFGRRWPLMLLDYQGIISTYLLVPFFLIGGISTAALRAMPITAGVIAIILTYLLSRVWFGAGVGRIAAILLAVSPSWIFWSRIGVYVVSEVVPITLGALLALTLWWRGGRAGWLWLGAFLLGLDLSTKLLGIWPIIATAACLFLLEGQRHFSGASAGADAAGRPRRTVRGALLSPAAGGAVVAFALGAFPFLLYNLETGGTWREIRNQFHLSASGVNNTTILPNLWEEMDRFKVLLDGGYFWFQGWEGQVYTNPLMPWAFGLAVLGLLVFTIRLQPQESALTGRAMLRAGAAYLPLLALTGRAALDPQHKLDVGSGALLAAVVLAGGALFVAALRAPGRWTRPAGWHYLGVTLLAGGVWLQTGSPAGQNLHGPTDLRTTDVVGTCFWLGLVALLALLGWSRAAHPWQRAIVASLGFIAAIIGQSFPTLSGLWVTHLLVILPIPQIVIAAALVLLGRLVLAALLGREGVAAARAPAGRATLVRQLGLASVPTLLVLAALLVGELRTDLDYHRDLARTGGLFAFSDAIYDLTDYVRGEANQHPIAVVEWGIRRQIQVLSKGQINPDEIFQYSPPTGDDCAPTGPEFYSALEQTLRQPDTIYLFTASTIGPFRRYCLFAQYLKERGLEPVLVHQSIRRTGEPMYQAYTVRQAAGR